jgi:hypothetical protein
MGSEAKETKPIVRAAGAVIGGVGTYFAAHWFNAWGLSDTVIWALAGGMTIAGFWFGPKVWDVVIHFV